MDVPGRVVGDPVVRWQVFEYTWRPHGGKTEDFFVMAQTPQRARRTAEYVVWAASRNRAAKRRAGR